MKIIIVGAGVSGLATFLQLRKVLGAFDTHEVSIYDSHQPQERAITHTATCNDLTDSTAVVGNCIGLTPHSVRLLRYIDEDLYQLFKSRGYVSKSYTFRTARGHTLATLSSGDGGWPEEYTISCPRYELWKCLYETVGKDNVQHREVVDVGLEADRSVVRFADGGKQTTDLVIGADGVRSVVKQAIFGEKDEKLYAPVYEGICGVEAFVNRDLPASVTVDRSMVFTFGPTGSFGYCSAAPQEKRIVGWWSNWGLTDIPKTNHVKPEEVRKQLLDRHGSWKDPVIQEIIATMSTDRVYPLWTTPELPYWGRDRAVILGDAAHTLQANSGQGASQALEDSVAFTLLLTSFLTRGDSNSDAIRLATIGVYRIRNPQIQVIKSQARNLFIMKRRINNIFVEYALYWFILLWTRFRMLGKLLVGRIFREPNRPNVEEQVRLYLETDEAARDTSEGRSPSTSRQMPW